MWYAMYFGVCCPSTSPATAQATIHKVSQDDGQRPVQVTSITDASNCRELPCRIYRLLHPDCPADHPGHADHSSQPSEAHLRTEPAQSQQIDDMGARLAVLRCLPSTMLVAPVFLASAVHACMHPDDLVQPSHELVMSLNLASPPHGIQCLPHAGMPTQLASAGGCPQHPT